MNLPNPLGFLKKNKKAQSAPTASQTEHLTEDQLDAVVGGATTNGTSGNDSLKGSTWLTDKTN